MSAEFEWSDEECERQIAGLRQDIDRFSMRILGKHHRDTNAAERDQLKRAFAARLQARDN